MDQALLTLLTYLPTDLTSTQALDVMDLVMTITQDQDTHTRAGRQLGLHT